MPLRDHYQGDGRESHSPIPAIIEGLLPNTDLAAREQALADMFSATSKDVRQLITRLRNTIEIYTDEGIIANAADMQIKVKPYETANIILVHTIWWKAPVGATGVTLQLGQKILSFTGAALPASDVYRDNVKFLLQENEIRQLSWTGAAALGGGDAFLMLFGTQLPEVKF